MKFHLIKISLCLLVGFNSCAGQPRTSANSSGLKKEIIQTLTPFVMKQSAWALQQQPVTVTASSSPRTAGGKHDFYSEGDYWWPDPKSPDSPYVQRDGLTNPDNFVAHRLAMIRFSQVVGSLASAYILTKEKKYSDHLLKHCRAWFTDTATMMNPNLLYAQAIKGRATGRGIGIIDAIQLMEVARGLQVIESTSKNNNEFSGFKKWFDSYINWVSTHKYGLDEMNAANNHGTCWVMQVAVFATFTGNQEKLAFCRDRYKNILLPTQMAADGGFPLELKRTKPYGYSIFNLDAMTTICQVLSTQDDNLWKYQSANTRSIQSGIDYLYPFIKNKNSWVLPKDVMYWDNWPVAQPFLVFGAVVFDNSEWLDTWKELEHEPQVEEVIRNLPVRNPLIWF